MAVSDACVMSGAARAAKMMVPTPPATHNTPRTVLACLTAGAFAIYPLVIVFGTNLPINPLRGVVVARTFLIVIGWTILLLWAMKLLKWNLAMRAIWLGIFFGLCGFFRTVLEGVVRAGMPIDLGNKAFAAVYIVVSAAIATVILRPWRRVTPDPIALSILAIPLLISASYPGIARYLANRNSWPATVDRMIDESLAGGSDKPSTPLPDIYYVVLDEFGRSDVLQEYYQYDLSWFVRLLQGRGFYVPEKSASNYPQTYPSLASTLNFTYLDPVSAAVSGDSRDNRPLLSLITRNALLKRAKAAGYRVIVIGDPYLEARRFESADVCICPNYGLDDMERTAIELTPLAPFSFRNWDYASHRRQVNGALTALRESVREQGPKFVFVHVLSPHPPFVFARDGTPRQPDTLFRFNDGDDFDGTREEYLRGYRDQAAYIARRVAEFVEAVSAQPGSRPVVVLHGDHGPGSMLRQNDAAATNVHERMSIFAAYAFPGDGPQPYPTITPINAARLMATRYLGAYLPPLPDESYFGPAKRPYDFVRVTDRVTGKRQP
jgi:hypothetical protein